VLLGALGSGAALLAAYLLLSQVLTPLGVRTVCDDTLPAGQCVVEPASATWWVAYGLLFPAAWRTIGLLGLAWLGCACLGLVASGLGARSAPPRLVAPLLLAAAAGTLAVLVAVGAIVRDTAPSDAPTPVVVAGTCALVGVLLLAVAASLVRRHY
jgi:hypothetical protein